MLPRYLNTYLLVITFPFCDLKQDFDVVRAVIPTKADNKSRGYALVDFATKRGANRAIEHLNSIQMDGRDLYAHIDER